MTTTTMGTLSDRQHATELRKAVIAATVGTTIEWYDFFLYGTAAGLVFGKLYFPNSDPLTGTLAAFGTYFIGFVGRPIGAAIFGHYGDRIGRKATLIATLMLMGIATFLIAFVPDLCLDRHLGRGPADHPADDPGHRRRRRVGRLGAARDGMGAHPQQPRVHRLLAAVRRAGGPVPRQPGGPRVQQLGPATSSSTWGWRIPFLPQHRAGRRSGLWVRLGILETPVFERLVAEQQDRARADRRGDSSGSRGRSSSRRCCAWPSRRRSTSSPPSSSPMAPAR